jgi:hypothetical protein
MEVKMGLGEEVEVEVEEEVAVVEVEEVVEILLDAPQKE